MTRFIRLPEVLSRVGVSFMTIDRWERQGLFPHRVRLGKNSVAWREDDVEQWCVTRVHPTTAGASDV